VKHENDQTIKPNIFKKIKAFLLSFVVWVYRKLSKNTSWSVDSTSLIVSLNINGSKIILKWKNKQITFRPLKISTSLLFYWTSNSICSILPGANGQRKNLLNRISTLHEGSIKLCASFSSFIVKFEVIVQAFLYLISTQNHYS